MALMVRLAADVVIHTSGDTAVVERPGQPSLSLPGEGRRLRLLCERLDSPQRQGRLLEALEAAGLGAGGEALLARLHDAGVLEPWPLGPALAELHQRTVTPREPSPSPASDERRRLEREYGDGDTVPLPAPALDGSLGEALLARRSLRHFAAQPITPAQLSTLLAFGCGARDRPALPPVLGGPPGRRTYPSGGALYPVEVMVYPLAVSEIAAGYYDYQVFSHRLRARAAAAGALPIERLLDDNTITGAALVILLFVDFARPSLGKYGEKGYRLALLEAGHLAQNLMLVAAALGLGAIPLCGFPDEELGRDAGLAHPDEAIVYAMVLGAVDGAR